MIVVHTQIQFYKLLVNVERGRGGRGGNIGKRKGTTSGSLYTRTDVEISNECVLTTYISCSSSGDILVQRTGSSGTANPRLQMITLARDCALSSS